jgi:hypothetical protein
LSELDFKLIGGEFLEPSLPPDKQYLFKYFAPGIPRTLLCYDLEFHPLKKRSIKFFLNNFIDHTGLVCSEQRLRYLLKKLSYLRQAIQQAEAMLDLDALNNIKVGKWKFGVQHEKKNQKVKNSNRNAGKIL